ncbi:glycosyltransferase family 4 protein [Bacillus sp. FJAT-22090]|uniref:glycosyltransferase family 4 protein n=1 Tax=Bacillus sp. FJAT-22090 TaxID=1581038 RepID=UPI0011A3073F|nr:glycosyltransferase family 4 protein [Bacillus sp. FJAT-22090]
MKILLATYWPIPHLGGVWNYMTQLKKRLELLGHEVDVLGYDEDNLDICMVNSGKKVGRDKLLPLLQAKMNKRNYPELFENKLVEYTEFQRYIFELGVAYFGLEKYDLIHTQDVVSTACIDRIRPPQIPLVATLHGSVAHEIQHQLTTIHNSPNAFMAKAYYEELEKIGATSPEVTIVANNWLKNILTDEFDVAEDQIKVLHYGFDTESFIKQMKAKTLITPPRNKKVIIYTGRLTELKGIQNLLVALGKLKRKRQDWVCWIVGSGDEEAKLRTKSKALGLEDYVYFLGKRDDVPSLLAKSDIYVLPTLLENQPLSLIESQIAGKAAIVSDVGGLPEMVKHKVTGLLTPPGDTNALYENMDLLLSNELLRRNLGSNAKKWGMTHWSIDQGMKSLMEVYNNAISIRKNGDKNVANDSIH